MYLCITEVKDHGPSRILVERNNEKEEGGQVLPSCQRHKVIKANILV